MNVKASGRNGMKLLPSSVLLLNPLHTCKFYLIEIRDSRIIFLFYWLITSFEFL